MLCLFLCFVGCAEWGGHHWRLRTHIGGCEIMKTRETTLKPEHDQLYSRRKAIVLGNDGGSVKQPHVPDRLDPWRPRILRAHSSESAVDSISAQFSSSEKQNDARKGRSLPGGLRYWRAGFGRRDG
ncbi:hypothetical protein U9M48_034597 [Paspalum notatum var. saurae]|uniref:Secreted protein n=1 Tax=Paspalum notatum var. saurae TaxID=547442 RepID=A0AAQ3UAS6_PASNO